MMARSAIRRSLKRWLPNDALAKLGGLTAFTAIRTWMATLDFQGAFYDDSVDPARSAPGKHYIYLMWHENILCPLYLRARCRLTSLLSKHRDADILVHAVRMLGMGVVRGSSFDGGAAAMRELMQVSKHSHFAITPDGPRGPRRVLAPGPIFLASRLNMPIVLLAIAYDRPWRTNSWDRFAIPRPGSRCRLIASPPLSVPRRADRDELEAHRLQLNETFGLLSDEAQAWADAGTRKSMARPLYLETVGRAKASEPAPTAPFSAARRAA